MVWSPEETLALQSSPACMAPTRSPKHTLTHRNPAWASRSTPLSLQPSGFLTSLPSKQIIFRGFGTGSRLDVYLLVPTGCHKVFAVGAPVARPDDPAVHGCVLGCVCAQWERRLCRGKQTGRLMTGKILLMYKTKGVIGQITCFIYLPFSREDELMAKLCYDYYSITSACLDPCSAVNKASPGWQINNPTRRRTSFQPLHFSQFRFMSRCCLFPRPKPF